MGSVRDKRTINNLERFGWPEHWPFAAAKAISVTAPSGGSPTAPPPPSSPGGTSQPVTPPVIIRPIIEAASTTGVYFPNYANGTDTAQELAIKAAMTAHPSVPFLIAVNPCSGPGNSYSAEVDGRIDDYQAFSQAKVIGYIPTRWGTQQTRPPSVCHPDGIRTIAYMKDMIDRYNDWYPQLDGLMYDEAATGAESNILSFYQQVTDYAHAHGLPFIKSNPGTTPAEVYATMFDNMSIREGAFYPTAAQLDAATFFGRYPKSKFSVTLHTLATLNVDWVKNVAKKYLGYIYITHLRGGDGYNPYAAVPTYFQQMVAALV